VTDMSRMFTSTGAFNGNISAWNVGNVMNMQTMFSAAASFNRNISGWDVRNVTRGRMSSMFANSGTGYRQNLSAWCVPWISTEPSSFDSRNRRTTPEWTDTTQPQWGTVAASCGPATVTPTTTPARGATGIAVDTNVVVTFKDNVTANTGTIVVGNKSIDVSDATQVMINDKTVTIDFNGNLTVNNTQTVILPARAFKSGTDFSPRVEFTFTTAS